MNSKMQTFFMFLLGVVLMAMGFNAVHTTKQVKDGEKDIHPARYFFCVLCIILFVGPIFAVLTGNPLISRY